MGENKEEIINYYKDKIVDTIKNCDDLRVLQYLEAFNRLYIEKNTKIEE
jgi:hypothetical protein